MQLFVSVIIELHRGRYPAGNPWIMRDEIFHLLPISSENKDDLTCEVFDLGEEEIENSFAAGVVARNKLVGFVNEEYTTVRFQYFLNILFAFGDTFIGKFRSRCFEEVISR